MAGFRNRIQKPWEGRLVLPLIVIVQRNIMWLFFSLARFINYFAAAKAAWVPLDPNTLALAMSILAFERLLTVGIPTRVQSVLEAIVIMVDGRAGSVFVP